MVWYWIVLIVYVSVCIVIGLAGLFVKPLKVVSRGMMMTFSFLVEIVYIVLVWWWLSLVRMAGGKAVPRLWLFGSR